jgi:uncharacterized protein YndB with AHSA1/START domain
MNHYRHTCTVDAVPSSVYAALTTAAGLRGWWTRDCDVAAGVGATLRFRFGANHKTMQVEALVADREVRWLCTGAHIACGDFTRRDEWVGTRIVFRLAPLDDGQRTRLEFEHVGLVPALECYDLCRGGWDHFLRSLQQHAAAGCGTPYTIAVAA